MVVCGVMRGTCLPTNSIGVAGLQQSHGRFQEDGDIEEEGPILDVVDVAFDALADFLLRIRLAAPAVDLCPSRDAGLDLVAREVTVDGVMVELVCGLGLQRVRPGTDERQITAQNIDELRQFIETCFAQEGPAWAAAAPTREIWMPRAPSRHQIAIIRGS